MSTSNRRLDRAVQRSRDLRIDAGRELRTSREQAGVSQDSAGRAVGMSGSQFGRIERAEIRHLSIDQLARASSAVGMRVSLRLYPDGDPVRDSPQARLLARLHVRLPAGTPWQLESPVGGGGDLRSWDARIGHDVIEAESRLRDVQASWRRITLKLRDDPTAEHVIWLLADTPSNRAAIAMVRELLRPELPLDTRAVLSALERGECPGASGIVFL